MSDTDLIRRGDVIREIDCGGCYGSCANPSSCQLEDVEAIRALPAVHPAPVTVDDMPSDGTCKKCGCAPTNAEGRCHACAEEMSDDLTPEAVERLCQMLLAVDKSRHGYTGHPRYNRDGMQAEQVIRALSARLAELEAQNDRLWAANGNLVAAQDAAINRAEAAEAALAAMKGQTNDH